MGIKSFFLPRAERFLKRIISASLNDHDKLNAKSLSSLFRFNNYIGNNLMLCQMRWGGFVVVPTWNIDVAVGAIRDGEIEQSTTKFMRSLIKSNSNYVNVGSNFGYYPALAGMQIGENGRIWSFEANPVMFAVLLRTAFYSGIINKMELYNRAVSDISNQEISFVFDYQFIGGGHVAGIYNAKEAKDLFWSEDSVPELLDENGKYRVGRGLFRTIKIKTIKLDDIIKDAEVDIIQIDAEGSEPLILLGAKEMIKRSADLKIVFEWDGYNYHYRDDQYKNKVMQMWELLHDEGFSIKHIIPHLDERGNNVLSAPLSLDDFLSAIHGDYYASRL